MFLREHNRITDELRKVRPDWGTWRVFQEARKIVGALLQQVTYGEYLLTVLREEDLVKFNLKLRKRGFSSSYNASVNPAAKNVFNAAAFRFGHSQVLLWLENKTPESRDQPYLDFTLKERKPTFITYVCITKLNYQTYPQTFNICAWKSMNPQYHDNYVHM